jgi:hypothetical protein
MMFCAIDPILMAHQWRNFFCSTNAISLGESNGAKGAPLVSS